VLLPALAPFYAIAGDLVLGPSFLTAQMAFAVAENYEECEEQMAEIVTITTLLLVVV
jgi:hypothetical protein